MYFDFKIIPVAHQSVRTGKGFFYQPTKIKNYKKSIMAMANQQMAKFGYKRFDKSIQLKVQIRYIFRYRKADTRSDGKLLPKITKPDVIDNLQKGIFDAMAGIIFEQDQQIYDIHAQKMWGTTDRIQIWFKEG